MATSTSKKSMGPPKKKLKDMNIDEFMTADFDSDSESPVKLNGSLKGKKKVNGVQSIGKRELKKPEKKAKKTKVKDDDNNICVSVKSRKKKHQGEKSTLATTLKDADPDFYEYLQGEDQNLLKNLEDLSESGSGSDSELEESRVMQKAGITKNKEKKTKKSNLVDKKKRSFIDMAIGEDDSDDDEEERGSKLHQIPEKLEVASDDSEAEDAEAAAEQTGHDGTILVTHALIEKMSEQLRTSPSMKILKQAIGMFHGAVYEAGGRGEESNASKYTVKGGAIFNGVVRMCLAHFAPALEVVLEIPSLSNLKKGSRGKSTMSKLEKMKSSLRSYLSDVLDLLSKLSDTTMISTVLKHVYKLTAVFTFFQKISRTFLKKMIKMWSTGEETTCILSFLIINKLIQFDKEVYLEMSIKKMYMAYVRNCKFVSPSTLPQINFMQRSLVELFYNDETLSYQYAFVYIRQLAIHLRNAMKVRKESTFQTVYNWQYIHCLGLWIQLLASFPSEALSPLIYPLTQTIIGTINLQPAPRYYPLRFHCVKLLNTLSEKTKTYIPTLPFLMEIFDQTDFNKRPKSAGKEPFNFAVILKFQKQQLDDKHFKDGLIDQLYEHLMDSYNVHAHSVGFPEFIIPSLAKLKDFLQKCKIANYCKQLKQIVDKIKEQSDFMTQRRNQSVLQLDNVQGLRRWEEQIDTSPLRKFYTNWRKLRDRELLHNLANKGSVSGAGFEMPFIQKKELTEQKATKKERADFEKLFEDVPDSDDETRFLLKEERPGNKKNKKRKRAADDDDDDNSDYSEFDDEELEILARSASEDEDDDDDGGDDDDEDADDDDDDDDEEEGDDSVDEDEAENDGSDMDYDSGSEDEDFVEEEVKGKAKKGNSNSKVKGMKKNSAELKTESGSQNVSDDDDGSDDVVEDFVLSDSDAESSE